MADYQQNFLASIDAGLGIGQRLRQRMDNNNLNRLAALAVEAPREQRQSVLGQIARVSPQAARAQVQAWNADDEHDRNELVGMARFIKSAPPEQQQATYQNAILPRLRARGMDAPDWTPETQGTILQTVDALTQWDPNLNTTPTGVREFQMLTNAAGYKPGSDDYRRAAGVRLGTEARPSSAGFGFFEFEGADGRKRLGRNNPRTGERELYDEASGAFVPLGGAPAMAGGYSAGNGANQTRVDIEGISPERQQQLANVMSTMKAAGFDDGQIMGWLEGALAQGAPTPGGVSPGPGTNAPTQAPSLGQPIVGPTASPGLTTGRTREEEAAAVTQAQIDTNLRNADRVAEAEANAAFRKAEAENRAKVQGEIAGKNTVRSRDAETILALINQAEPLVRRSTGSGLGAKRDEAMAWTGQSTPGGEAIAALRVLSGQLIGKMPRMEGPQSDADRRLYEQMAGDLANPNIPVPTRLAALQTIRALNMKYANSGSQGGRYQMGQVIENNGRRFRVIGGDMNDPEVEEVR